MLGFFFCLLMKWECIDYSVYAKERKCWFSVCIWNEKVLMFLFVYRVRKCWFFFACIWSEKVLIFVYTLGENVDISVYVYSEKAFEILCNVQWEYWYSKFGYCVCFKFMTDLIEPLSIAIHNNMFCFYSFYFNVCSHCWLRWICSIDIFYEDK